MNIGAYDFDSIGKLVRDLQAENRKLRALLNKAAIPYSESEVFSDALSAAGNPIFLHVLGGKDVFAKRAKNGNYYPQCDNRWNTALCPKQKGKKGIVMTANIEPGQG